MEFTRQHILGLEEMSAEEILHILDTAEPMLDVVDRPIKKLPTLRGKVVVNLFFEPSTRTRTSFELAGKYLSADTINIATSTSSVVKGESLKDTAQTLEVMGTDVVVMRHGAGGAPHQLTQWVKCAVINAGDGIHEHPTQGLLDLFTIRQKKGGIEGLKVVILGDVLHSRVAKSNIWGLTKMGAQVTVAGPSTLIPAGLERLGVNVTTDVDRAVADADVINVLRIQMERQKKSLFPSVREYARLFGLNARRLALAKPDCLVLHPGPMNRGLEISPDVAEGDQQAINQQVRNGVAIRMALLYLVTKGDGLDAAAH